VAEPRSHSEVGWGEQNRPQAFETHNEMVILSLQCVAVGALTHIWISYRGEPWLCFGRPTFRWEYVTKVTACPFDWSGGRKQTCGVANRQLVSAFGFGKTCCVINAFELLVDPVSFFVISSSCLGQKLSIEVPKMLASRLAFRFLPNPPVETNGISNCSEPCCRSSTYDFGRGRL
jgi:hypothetical protein